MIKIAKNINPNKSSLIILYNSSGLVFKILKIEGRAHNPGNTKIAKTTNSAKFAFSGDVQSLFKIQFALIVGQKLGTFKINGDIDVV